MAWVILLAAGQGRRLAGATGGLAKQFLIWKGAPLYWESVVTFSRCRGVDGIVFVFPESSVEEERIRISALMEKARLGIPWVCVAGGALRQDSVRNGFTALPNQCDFVLIHDAARPFVTLQLIERMLGALAEDPGVACIPAIPVVDTIKVVDAGGYVLSTPDRDTLFAVQTPQAFPVPLLRLAHARAVREGWTVTDDASLMERCGHPVRIVAGEVGNRKVTTTEDLEMLHRAEEHVPCAGYGYDVHRYAVSGCTAKQPARTMRLGGIVIENAPPVFAHSDGDVLLHALMDALLGCIGEGDIGTFFPDSDPAFDNISSVVLLKTVMEHVARARCSLVHVDLTVVAQIPRIGPYREVIRGNVAQILGIEPRSVNVKATTEEGLGFTGEGLGIKAVAVVTCMQHRTGL